MDYRTLYAKTVAALKLLAKQNGVKLPAGVSKMRIVELILEQERRKAEEQADHAVLKNESALNAAEAAPKRRGRRPKAQETAEETKNENNQENESASPVLGKPEQSESVTAPEAPTMESLLTEANRAEVPEMKTARRARKGDEQKEEETQSVSPAVKRGRRKASEKMPEKAADDAESANELPKMPRKMGRPRKDAASGSLKAESAVSASAEENKNAGSDSSNGDNNGKAAKRNRLKRTTVFDEIVKAEKENNPVLTADAASTENENNVGAFSKDEADAAPQTASGDSVQPEKDDNAVLTAETPALESVNTENENSAELTAEAASSENAKAENENSAELTAETVSGENGNAAPASDAESVEEPVKNGEEDKAQRPKVQSGYFRAPRENNVNPRYPGRTYARPNAVPAAAPRANGTGSYAPRTFPRTNGIGAPRGIARNENENRPGMSRPQESGSRGYFRGGYSAANRARTDNAVPNPSNAYSRYGSAVPTGNVQNGTENANTVPAESAYRSYSRTSSMTAALENPQAGTENVNTVPSVPRADLRFENAQNNEAAVSEELTETSFRENAESENAEDSRVEETAPGAEQRSADGNGFLRLDNTDNVLPNAAVTEMLQNGEYPDGAGVLDIQPDGYGILRAENFLPGNRDIYVSIAQIRRFNLRSGDYVEGKTRPQREGDRFAAMLYISAINGCSPLEAFRRPRFEELTPIYPDSRIRLENESGGTDLALRCIDLLAPIGKGQRGMIVSPPKAGKTVLLKKIANAITENCPEIHLIVLLIDERPEEVTDLKRSIRGEVVYSTFDEMPDNHTRLSEMTLDRAQRLVEMGKDVVILLDSITRLARAYNLVIPPTGRSLSGGLDPGALHKPKRFFGAARNIENGGSLTIIATALVETGSRMDDIIYEEFKGTGNMELHLDRKLSERRIFPAIELNKSGTRRDELLFDAQEAEGSLDVRRMLSSNGGQDMTEQLIELMEKTKTNREFLTRMKGWMAVWQKDGFVFGGK